MKFAESTVEAAALEWLGAIGYETAYGPDVAPAEPLAERASFDQVVLVQRLESAVARLNPRAPLEAREDAIRRILRLDGVSALERNQRFHQFLARGVATEYRDPS